LPGLCHRGVFLCSLCPGVLRVCAAWVPASLRAAAVSAPLSGLHILKFIMIRTEAVTGIPLRFCLFHRRFLSRNMLLCQGCRRLVEARATAASAAGPRTTCRSWPSSRCMSLGRPTPPPPPHAASWRRGRCSHSKPTALTHAGHPRTTADATGLDSGHNNTARFINPADPGDA
jgi:hypothetical protein